MRKNVVRSADISFPLGTFEDFAGKLGATFVHKIVLNNFRSGRGLSEECRGAANFVIEQVVESGIKVARFNQKINDRRYHVDISNRVNGQKAVRKIRRRIREQHLQLEKDVLVPRLI